MSARFSKRSLNPCRKPHQGKQVQPAAVDVVAQVRQFVRNDCSPACFGSSEEDSCGVHPNRISHPASQEETGKAESRLKVIGLTGELPHANVCYGEFG